MFVHLKRASAMNPLQSRITQINKIIQTPDESHARAAAITVLGAGLIYIAVDIFRGDILAVLVFAVGWLVLLALVNFAAIRQMLTDSTLNFRHILHIILYWLYSAGAVMSIRLLGGVDAVGKDSRLFYVFLLAFIALTWAAVRALLIVVRPRVYNFFSTQIPLWEQTLLAANEVIAAGMVAYIWSSVLVRLFQPSVFTTRLNLIYGFGLGIATVIFYLGIQLMWVQRYNEWISRNEIWVRWARLISPFVLFVTTIVIASRFTARTDPRTASLVDNPDLDFAVLSLVPVIWLMVFLVMVLVFSGRRGLRQRFLPDPLLEHLPKRIELLFRAISDMDLLLVVGVLTTFIPVYLLFFGADGGLIGSALQAILRRGSALIETTEQALAILFVLPFYFFIVLILMLYAVIISRPHISSDERDEMMRLLPVGFLISMVIVLYLFAIPFTQVFIEGRLPTFSRDLGRILAFYILIPVILLYLHFLPLVRFPYGRGQRLWREATGRKLDTDLNDIDRRIRNLNQELSRMDNKWTMFPRGDDLTLVKDRLETLHRYIHLNSERDDLNMRRLQIVSSRQNLAEISDTPFSVTVARLPLRVISIGIPLLLAFQLYQWAVLNEGLREVVNNPNLTLTEFIQILLDNIEF
jgi:hypothetical protein